MIDITVQNFETELLNASLQQPVLLDIWAPWCGPCKTLGPVLEKLELDYGGRVTLGKLNADEQPDIAGQLSQMFGVRSIPFCVLFKEGQPIDGFVGALPEAQIRQFLDKHVPSVESLEAEDDIQEAQALLAEGDTDSALERLQAAVAVDPANEAARYDYLRALLSAGHLDEARVAFEPVASQAAFNSRFAAIQSWISAQEQLGDARDVHALRSAIEAQKRDFGARFELAQRLFAEHRFTEAMDELLEIIMRDKAWNDEAARKTYVAILELMNQPAAGSSAAPAKAGALELAGKSTVVSSNPVLDQYRRKLSMALF